MEFLFLMALLIIGGVGSIIWKLFLYSYLPKKVREERERNKRNGY